MALALVAIVGVRPVQADVLTGPSVTVDSGPKDPSPTSDATPTFGFTSSDLLAATQCRVDSDDPAPCSSPYTTRELADGEHSLEVVATDAAGNSGPTASRAFTVDTRPPDAHISGPTGRIGDRTPTFSFGAEPGASFQCKLDGAAYAPCTSPVTLGPLADGSHIFTVLARDAAGNQDPTPAASSFAVDTTTPETVITSGPPARTTDSTPGFAFIASQAGSRFECSLDGAPFTPCTSPTKVGPLPVGDHAFAVRAINPVGSVDSTPASLAFTIVEPAVDRPDSAGPTVYLATQFAQDLGRVLTRLRRSELPHLRRRRRLEIAGVHPLLPGTASIRATTRLHGRRVTVLRGDRRLATAGKGTVRLKVTRAGRRLFARARRVRMTVAYTFTASRGIRMTASARVTVWRRWLTLAEVARVARRWIPRYFHERPRSLTLDRCSRRGPTYMRCGRVSWLHRGTWWFVRMRVRQTAHGFRQRMTDASTL